MIWSTTLTATPTIEDRKPIMEIGYISKFIAYEGEQSVYLVADSTGGIYIIRVRRKNYE